jgi:hypothetical protein
MHCTLKENSLLNMFGKEMLTNLSCVTFLLWPAFLPAAAFDSTENI